MASLMRPIQRSLLVAKHLKNVASLRLASSSSSSSNNNETQITKEPKLEKVDLDPMDDPKKARKISHKNMSLFSCSDKTLEENLPLMKKKDFADPWDILYGAEKWEIAMKMKGYNDPYDQEALLLKKDSTKDSPNVVTSLLESRVVGCICNEEVHHVKYMWIHKGETKRCACGHWFTLKDREIPDLSEFGKFDANQH